MMGTRRGHGDIVEYINICTEPDNVYTWLVMVKKPSEFWSSVIVIGMSIVIPALAVITGALRPPYGVIAAIGLSLTLIIGHFLGLFLFSSVRKSRRGVFYWAIFGILLGGETAVKLSKVWGVVGGTLFGVSLGGLIIAIGCLEFKTSENPEKCSEQGGHFRAAHVSKRVPTPSRSGL
jgi:hypothetical protein